MANSIPKRIFFYWGGDKLSWLRYMTLYSFRKFNPDWEINLYTYRNPIKYKPWNTWEEQDFFKYHGNDYFPLLANLDIKEIYWDYGKYGRSLEIGENHKSNILRWEQLSGNGGVHSDMDILYIKPIDLFYNKMNEFDMTVCYTTYWSIGLLSYKEKNRFFADVLHNGLVRVNAVEYQSSGVVNIKDMLVKKDLENGADLESVKRNYPELSVYNFDFDVIYPWTFTESHEIFLKEHKTLKDTTIGIHWFGGNPTSQDTNNKLNHVNYMDYNSTFSYFAKKILQED